MQPSFSDKVKLVFAVTAITVITGLVTALVYILSGGEDGSFLATAALNSCIYGASVGVIIVVVSQYLLPLLAARTRTEAAAATSVAVLSWLTLIGSVVLGIVVTIASHQN